jgi:flagellar biogenesis protein FliO
VRARLRCANVEEAGDGLARMCALYVNLLRGGLVRRDEQASCRVREMSYGDGSVMGRWLVATAWFWMIITASLTLVPEPVLAAGTHMAQQSVRPEQTGVPAYMKENGSLNLRDYDEPRQNAEAPLWQTVLSMLFKLLLVVGLIILSLGVFKRYFQGRLGLPTLRGKNVVLLESTMLSPQHTVHVVSLGGDRLLVLGASAGGLALLTEISDPQAVTQFIQSSQGRDNRFGREIATQEAMQSDPTAFDELYEGTPRGLKREWEG